jgi:hypothetical protein
MIKLKAILTEAEVSRELWYHIDNNISLEECVFRYGSPKYFTLINEARLLACEEGIDFDNQTRALLETDLGKFGIYEGKEVALDFPLINHGYLNEFVGKELEARNEPLYDKLVPGQGDAETVEGEMLRAINRIAYRFYNDGDKYFQGYGTETAGPAHSFLINANHPLKSAMNKIFNEPISDSEYEQMIKDALDMILDYIESRQGKYSENTLGGIFNYEPEFEDDEEDYDDYTYDYDDDEDDDYYQESINESKKKKKKTPPLGKPKRGGPKAYYVYVRDPKTKRIKKVTFGSGGLRAKINNPKARKAFAARHKCSQKKDRTKASYWSCRLPRYAKQLGLSVKNPGGFW